VASVVLARDRPQATERTIQALVAQHPPSDHLLLVDNDATDAVREVLERAASGRPRTEILRLDRNYGCSGGFERGLAHLLERDDLDLVCGFDDDASPLPGCLRALTAAAGALPDVGAVGALSHSEDGTLAWPMLVDGEAQSAHTVEQVLELAARRESLPVPSLSWHGLMLPVEVLRRHGNVWGDLFLQYEDIELGMRLRRAGLRSYLVPGAGCLHPPPPPARAVRIAGRQIDVTAQSAAKEYLTLRNGLVVRSRYEGLRFWYGTGPFVLLRGLLSSFALDLPRGAALRHVFLQGVFDAIRGRLGPPPTRTAQLGRGSGYPD
jgi:glycosyltransferase involved in cell wall biosynthesis